MSEISYEPGAPVPDDVELYEDDDGVYAVDPEGYRVDVEYPDEDDDGPEAGEITAELGLSPEGSQVYTALLDANDGDHGAAIEAYGDFESRMAAAHGIESETNEDGVLTSDEMDAWLDEHPAVKAAGFDEFLPYYNAAGEDLDAGYALFSARLDADAKAAEKLGYTSYDSSKPRSIAEALDQAYDEGLIGNRKPYVHKRGGYDSSIDDAVGALQEDLSAKNAVARQSEARVRKARRAG